MAEEVGSFRIDQAGGPQVRDAIAEVETLVTKIEVWKTRNGAHK